MGSIKKILKSFILIVGLLFIINVKADTKNISVTDISVKNKSGTITVVDPVLDSNEVTSNITFNQIDDFVTFELTLKNNESEKYKIESITDNNTNENISIEYNHGEDYISTGETTTVTIKLKYKKQLLNVEEVNLNNLSITIKLVNEEGKEGEIIINPITGDSLLHYLVLLIIAVTGILLIITKKKIKGLKIGNIFIVFAIIMIPFVTFAKEQYEVKIKFDDIVVKGEFEEYTISINPGNGEAVETRTITYGQKLGDLPADPSKDGYAFSKWVDEEGNEVTKDTVITGPIEVIATYNVVTYDITYNLSGGSLPSGKSNPSKYTIESQSITLNNPSKQGYTFSGWTGTGLDGQTTSVTIEHGSTGDRAYLANYLANDDTEYTVTHKFAKLNGGYEEETVTEHGTTGSTIPAPRKSRTGFVTPEVQNVTIEADGSASVTYTYEREEYAFSITDRTYVDSTSTVDGTYPYGTEITIKAQERPGYDFAWSDGDTNLERTFTLENKKELTPVYTADEHTPYTVKHYKMKINGQDYEIADTQNLTGETDSPISPAVNTYEGFTSPEVQSTTIGGDGHTVVEYYYTRNKQTVTFTNTEYIEEEVTTGEHYYGEQITLTAKTRDGYTFTGWTTGEISNPLTITVGTSDISVGPEYTAKTNTTYVVNHYKMNLDGENYTKVEEDTQNLTGTTDSEITPATNTYDGFTSPSTQTTTISGKGDTVVNYYYSRNKYTLTINHPEYLEEDKSGSYYYEEEISLTAIDRQGYTFAGWNTGETTKTITFTMPVDGITKEATYTSNTDTTYSVTHKYAKLTEGYDEVTINGTGTTGETIEAPLNPRTGFENPEVQNITITADGEANVTYIYERKTFTFSITDRTYLDSTSTANGTYPYETEITLKAQERTGYTFKWSDDVTDLERTFNLTEATTLSLIYTANTYTLTADANEGTIEETTGWTGTGASATKTITYNSTYGTLPTVKRTGYTFTGWTSIIGGIEVNISEDTTVFTTTDQTITANWSINSYTVSFDVDGGSSVPSQTINYGGKVTKPANPTKENFAFAGWYRDDTLTTPFDFENTTIDKTTTIYAKWSSCNGFATASWNTIVSNLESDSSYYPVGCQKWVQVGSVSYKARLANTSTPAVCNTPGYSQTACGNVIEFIHVIDARQMKSNGKNAGGWKETGMVNYLNTDFYNSLASDLKAVLIPTYPIVSGSGNDNNSANITNEDINLNKIYYLSAKEVGFDLAKDNKKNDTRTLDYYEANNTDNDRKKTTINNIATDWWLRTASSTNDSGYFRVESEGTTDSYNAAGTGGNTPAFRIGRMPEFTVTFNTDEGSEIASQTVSYGSTATRPGTNPTKTGFIFDDWYTDDTYEAKYDFTTPITGDTTIYARYNDGCYNFRTDSWSTISSNIETDPSYYPLGCTKEVEMDMNDDSTPESYTVRLSNTSTPEECNTLGYSQTSCGTVVEFIDIPVSKKMNSDNDNAGGWKETELVTYLNSDFYNKLPSDLKTVIIPTYPIVSGSGSGGVSDNIINTDTTKNKLYLLSGKEVGYILTHDNKKEETRLLDYYYANYGNASRIKTNVSGEADEWWLRTAFGDSTAGFYTVGDSGTSGVEAASYSYGVAPAFRIGKNTYTVIYDANGGTVTNPTKEVIKGEEIGTLPTPTPATGKIFDKWYTGIDSGVEVTSIYQVNNDITIYARYTNQEFTVTFDTDGGSEVSSQTINSGGTVTRPTTDPEKTGYVFDDWYTTDQYTTKFDFENTAITEDTTIYAKFEKLKVCADNENITRLSENTCSNNENITVGDGIVCKRAINLHQEECNNGTSNSYCLGAGHSVGDTITFGSCGTNGTLSSGDAFTCDVNGDGDFDELTERFYYVSDYYNTTTKEFATDTAVLIYYNNVTDGISCNKDTYKYNADNKNYNGGISAVPNLPLIDKWDNINLNNDTRQLLTENDKSSISWYDTNYNLVEFDYHNYSSRLPIYQEINDSCGENSDVTSNFGLSSCNYLFENTKYTNSQVSSKGYWLDTIKNNSSYVLGLDSEKSKIYTYYAYDSNTLGVRPVIEVPKTAIDIGSLPQYTVSFNSDGGSTIADIEVDAGDSINELPTPTKADSVFIGWFESVTDETPVTEPYTPSGDITLIAKWNKIICKKATTLLTETCNSANGKGCKANGYSAGDVISYGNVITSDTLTPGDVLDCDVDGTGYNQRFYYVTNNSDNAVLISYTTFSGEQGQSNIDVYYNYDTSLTLLPTTAQWSNLPVKFEIQSGDYRPARMIRLEELEEMTGLSYSELKTDGALNDYDFLFENSLYSGIGQRSTAWLEQTNIDGNDTRIRYRNDSRKLDEVTSDKYNTSTNCIKPIIEVPLNLIEDAYVVRFNPNGGTMNNEYKLVKKGSSLGTLPTATRANYELENWYTSLDFIIPIDENTIPNGYNTYYAKWVGNVSAGIINHDSFILEPNEEDDITFSNASEIESLTYESSDDDIVTVNNGHLVAISEGDATITITGTKSHLTRTVNVKVVNESNTFIVSFDSQGGSQVSDIPVTKNTALGVLPSAPTKSEYDFGGWFTNTNYSVEVTVDTIITSNVTFYALWIPTNAVAEINRSYFTSVQAAVDSEMSGKTTINLLKDVSYTTKIDLFDKNTTKDIVLDLQGHTITNTSTNAIRTKATLEIKNGTIIGTSANGTIDIGSGGYLVINSGRIENSGERAAIYNDGGTVEIGGTAYITTNAQWKSDNNRGSVQNKSGTTTITGGTIINTRSSDSYAVSVSVGTLVIGTKNNAYDTENLILQGETGGIYSNVNYSLYDGIIKGKTVAVNDENKITSIEDGSFKINDTGDNYNVLYYTLEIPKYKIEFDANGGEVDPTFIYVNQGSKLGTLPEPTRTSYIFDGWFTEISGGIQIDENTIPTGNIKYYAKWHYDSSNEIVEFRTTNDAMKVYYNNIETWKNDSSNFPTWSNNNKSPNWALDSVELAAMKTNFDNNNCMCADNQCTSSGTVHCDKPNGYFTGFNEQVNVYTSDETTKAKGNLVSYSKSNNGTIYNLIPGEVYYWELASDDSIYGYVRFNSERRILDTGDVRNVRDLGGLPVDQDDDGIVDGHLDYGRLFRGIRLSSSSSVSELTALGINSELDLREANSDTNQISRYNRIEAQNYYVNPNTTSTDELNYYNMTRAAVKYAMEEIVNGKNLYFHCRIGTDRTGTVAYVLEGLLGVPEEDRIQDYELSFFYGLIRIHRYHNEKPGSTVGTGKERFVYMHNFMPDNDDIYDWYMAGTDDRTADEALINAFRSAMIK